jgi:SAM-dependent methyltransferase
MTLSEAIQVLRRVAWQLAQRVFTGVKYGLLSDNVRMQREYPDVRFPPSDLATAALNHCDYRKYLESGLAHARFVMETIRKQTTDPDLTICEWGCGPGRIIRHLPSLDHGIAQLTGTDCHEATIDWCRKNLPGIEFLAHGMNPPFPLAAGSLDVVYCCAVFSHLDEPLHHAWVAEILRLLRPGGLLIASFNGSRLEDRLTADERNAYREGRLVVRHGGKEGEAGFVSFAGDRFIRERLFNRFDNITRRDDAPFLQTVWTATAPVL